MNIFSFFKKENHEEILPLVEQYVPKDAIIIDANAGAGSFTRLFAGCAPQGHVYAFAPGRRLAKLVAVNRLHNVSLFPISLEEASHGSCPVMKKTPSTTLDRFATHQGLKKVDFIRSDAHISILRGAQTIIDKFRPVLLLATNDDGGATEEVQDFLALHNYRIDSTKDALWCVAEQR